MKTLDRFGRDPVGNTFAVVVLAGMVFSVTALFKNHRIPFIGMQWSRPSIWIPILCLVGIIVAGYLAYVETNHLEAVCGPVGDCNTVQQSKCASLLGIMPIGVLGFIGYAAILVAWFTGRYGSKKAAQIASFALPIP